MTLKPGLYALCRDVPNTKADRRWKHDWRALSVWKSGTLFVLRETRLGLSLFTGRYAHEDIDATDPRWAVLIEALEPAPDTLHNRLVWLQRGEGLQATLTQGILHLVHQGRITLDDIEQAMRWCEAATADLTREQALALHAEHGGYLVRCGSKNDWMVLEGDPASVAAVAGGYRDVDAYGVDLSKVTEDQWCEAGWDESRLPGYEE